MARYTEAVCKLCRREGQKLFLKGERCYTDKCAINRRAYAPGQHGQGRKKTSEYGLQLRAKEVRSLAEKMITIAKEDNLHNRRMVMSFLTKESVTNKLFKEIAPKYADRNGGYTRVTKLGPRRGDAAEMAILELL